MIWLVVVGLHFLGHIRAAATETWRELQPRVPNAHEGESVSA